MSRAPLRVGGRGDGLGGGSVIWSVSEGTRGRRWREVRIAGGGIASSLLLETDPTGQFAHLELSTPSGLLTLHPEGDGTLHGHAVVSDGIEHVAGLPWDADGIALVEGSTVCRVAAANLLHGLLEQPGSRAHHAVRIPPTLWPEVVPIRVQRVDRVTWRFADEEAFALDASGLPILNGGETWPLERVDEPERRHR